ncbi:MAG TPA: cytochrome C [Desulfobacteraceae bacterium]|nr:cytochrome C [Desulfobacteraceae bacterium]
MKSHVLRPLWVAIAFVALVLLARYFLVPDDFGVHGESFTYNFYRAGNVQEWKDFPVKFRGSAVCVDCHSENEEMLAASLHAAIQCENCHGPGLDHPESGDPGTMILNRGRALCLRCHADLGYAGTSRAAIPSIDPVRHNVDSACIECHEPHNPDLEDME